MLAHVVWRILLQDVYTCIGKLFKLTTQFKKNSHPAGECFYICVVTVDLYTRTHPEAKCAKQHELANM